MIIDLQKVSKRFLVEWVIKDFSYTFSPNKIYGLKGANGTGKSTLLTLVSSALVPSSGKVEFRSDNKVIPEDDMFKHIAYAAPFAQLVEHFTPAELFDHYTRFKSIKYGKDEFLSKVLLKKEQNQYISEFSSGMKHRLGLGLCLFSEAPILLLDEPTSYLDKSKQDWFYNNLTAVKQEQRVIIMTSNSEKDFDYCDELIDLDRIM
jgi:ABC-type multidrug transport system ATPase subunit